MARTTLDLYFYIFSIQMVFTEKTKEAMGGLDRSQKFLMASRVGTCGKMASLEVHARFHRRRAH